MVKKERKNNTKISLTKYAIACLFVSILLNRDIGQQCLVYKEAELSRLALIHVQNLLLEPEKYEG